MSLFHRPTQEALRRSALAGSAFAALLLFAGCGGGGGGIGGSNTTKVEGYFLTPSGGLLQIPGQLAPNAPSVPANLAPVKNPPANAPYFLEMNSHAGDVSNGIQVSATNTTAVPALPSGELLATDGGYLVKSSTSAAINGGRVLSVTLGFSDTSPTLTPAQITSLRVLEYVSVNGASPAWLTLPNYFVNPTVTPNAEATGVVNYPADTTLQTFPNTVTAQFGKFNTGGSTYFAVAYAPDNPALDPFFGTYAVAFKPTLGAVPAAVDVDTGGSADANGNFALTANGVNAAVPVTGAINTAGTVTNFTTTENGVTYTLTGSFTLGNPAANPPTQTMGSGSYTGAGASGTWTATVQ